ncbi:M4 family metallopeptidase [Luteimonas aquatica]|uniref:M4 family metallopeptidase n=1 Tax=Luteimonas aquatica TaxID=450364 RepID=UPI001F56043E|nr:M4 family metallopeptidase [Luteimonas aquatica]
MNMQSHPLKLAIATALALPLSAFAASPGFSSGAAQRAQALADVTANAKALQRNDSDSFTARDTVVDADGTEHVRFDRSYRGLRMIGGDVIVSSRNGTMKSARLSLRSALRPALTARIGKQQAADAASARFGGDVLEISSNQLVVYARGPKPVLAYEVIVQGDPTSTHSGMVTYYVDAIGGKTLAVEDNFQTAAAVGTGNSYYYGDLSLDTDKKSTTRYDLIDTTRGNGSVYDMKGATVSNALDFLLGSFSATLFTDSDNTWGNHATSDRATVAADIQYGVSKTWDYYKNVHGRNGIFNDGAGIKSYAHTNFKTSSGATTGANAAFLYAAVFGIKAMVYGDGDATRGYGPMVAIDVAGHEMSHGVNAATANLAYSGDAGGLNEGNSDILGTLVEFYTNNVNDPGDYRIGETLRTGGLALRDMYNQGADGKSFNCYIGGSGFDPNQAAGGAHDPHYTSGVANRFFYLLAEGAVVPAGSGLTPAQLVCNGDTAIAGIGRDKAGKIWYRALTTKFTSSTTYPQARAATLAAASELYGAGSAEYSTVARAWSAANVN